MNRLGINLITPFTESNEVDLDAIGRIIESRLSEGIKRFYVGGECGEFESMNDEEIITLVTYIKEKVGVDSEVFLYTGFTDIRRTVLLTFKAFSVGVNAIIVKSPNVKTNEKGLLNYYKTIIQSSPIPVYIENSESVDIAVMASILDELSLSKNFAGVLEGSLEIERYIKIKSIVPLKELICTREKMMIPAFSVGFDKVASPFANLWSEEIKMVIDLYFKGEFETSREIYLRLYPLFEMMEVEPNPIPLKTTMNMLGQDVGEFRPPLTPMNPDHASNIIKTLMDMNQIKF